MFVRLSRPKPRYWLLTLAYRLVRPWFRLLPVRRRIALLLDIGWIANRFAHEESYRLYSQEKHPTFLGTVNFLLPKLKKGARVLDLGCGHGTLSYSLAQAGCRVVGVDHEASHLEEARRVCAPFPDAAFFQEDARAYLTRTGEKFDVLVLRHVIEHLERPEELLRSLAADFPLLYVEVPDFDATYFNHVAVDVGARLTYADADHLVEFDRDELARVIKLGGYQIRESEYRYGVLRAWCDRA
ncbi:MAG: class I SAM-dependent methyltransferase [Bdellovibrionota bacterium]